MEKIKIDTKQYDATPEMMEQAVKALCGQLHPNSIVFHYCKLTVSLEFQP